MEYKKVYFVSGIDTDAGKSYATGYLARKFREQGVDTVTQKFIQTGCGDDCDVVSEDIVLHRHIMGIGLLPEDLDFMTAPVRFSYPASPDLAARIDGRPIDFEAIERSTRELSANYDVVLIEGAGGLMVPLEGLYTTLDYVQQRQLPVILVTNPKLGSVNHTLLSLEVCQGRGVEVDMLVYNASPATSDEITEDTRQTLKEYIARFHPKCVFEEVPYLEL